MDNELVLSDITHHACTNCGAPTALRYCSQCGQKQRTADDFRLLHFFGHVLEEFTSLDNKVLVSLKHLFFRPGQLTLEWTQGRERRYVKPIQLFILANVFYFLFTHYLFAFNTFTSPLYVQYSMQVYSPIVSPIVDAKIAAHHLTFQEFAAKYDEVSAEQARTLLIVMVPMFASLLALLSIFKHRYFVEHLVFSLNFYTFFLLVESVGIVVFDLLLLAYCRVAHIPPKVFDWDMTSTLAVGLMIGAYLFFALRRVYGSGRIVNVLKAAALSYSVLYIIFAYRFILFFTTIFAMRV